MSKNSVLIAFLKNGALVVHTCLFVSTSDTDRSSITAILEEILLKRDTEELHFCTIDAANLDKIEGETENEANILSEMLILDPRRKRTGPYEFGVVIVNASQ